MPEPRPYVVHEEQCEVEGDDDAHHGRVRWRTLLSGDRSPTESLTVGVAEVEPGLPQLFRTHRHAQPEIYYVLSGHGVVTLEGEEHALRPGSAVFIPGGAEHGVRNTGTEILRLLYTFEADSFAEVEYEFSSP